MRHGLSSPILLAIAFVAACGGGGTPSPATKPPIAESCATQLAPRAAPLERATSSAPPAAAAPSRLIVNAEFPLSRIKSELEAKVARRIADERGRDIGAAGSLDFTADRGPINVSIEGDSLVVRTDVTAHAQACAKGRCYASCDPAGVARAVVPLRLQPDFRFAPSRVSVSFTRRCVVRALRGFLKVDVTPTIESQLGVALRRIEQDIDARLPPVRPQAERLWAELSRPRKLPLGGCVIVDPRGVVQGPVTPLGSGARARFALVAVPEVRARCDDPLVSRPLAPLVQEPALPAEEDMTLGMVAPLSTIALALEGIPAELGNGRRARVDHASVKSSGRALALDLNLRGELCGDVALDSGVGWALDGRSLTLNPSKIAAADAPRLAAASLDDKAFARLAVQVEPLLAVEELGDTLKLIASELSDSSLEVRATVAPAQPADAAARGDMLVAWVKLRGSLTFRQY